MNQVRDKCKQLCEYYTSQAQSHSASENWNTFKNGLNQVIEENIPTKMIKEKHNLPWITQSIKRIVRRRKRARCKARRTRSIPDWERYKELTKLMKRELKKAHSNHISNIFESNNAKQINKRAFGYIRALKNDIVGIPSLRKSNGMMAETATDKAEELQTQYLSVFTRDNMLQSLPSNYEQFPTMPKINIHPSGVKKLLDDLDTNKATGPDLIPTRVLKECSSILAPVLAELFQNSIDTGIVPDDWLTANVVGIYKKGDKQEPANYRPVSLTSVTCKVLEHIIYSQIMSHYNKHNFLSEYQHGFRRGYSCETQLLATVEDIQRGIDSSSNS